MTPYDQTSSDGLIGAHPSSLRSPAKRFEPEARYVDGKLLTLLFDYYIQKSPWTSGMHRRKVLGVSSREELEELLNQYYPAPVDEPIGKLDTLPQEVQHLLFDAKTSPYLGALIFHSLAEEDPQTNAMIRLTGDTEPFILKTYLLVNESYHDFPFELLRRWTPEQWSEYLSDMMFYKFDEWQSLCATNKHYKVMHVCHEHMGPAWVSEHFPNIRALELMSEGVYQFSDELLTRAVEHSNPMIRAHMACIYEHTQRLRPKGVLLQCQHVFEGALLSWSGAMERCVHLLSDSPDSMTYIQAAHTIYSSEHLTISDASDVFNVASFAEEGFGRGG